MFAKQAKELGLNQPLFGIEVFESADDVQNSGGALIGQWYVNASSGQSDFLERYKQAYPTAGNYGSANCYDAVMLLSKALDEGKTTGPEIAGMLAKIEDYDGALGTFSSTKDNRFTLPAAVKVVTKDGFEFFK